MRTQDRDETLPSPQSASCETAAEPPEWSSPYSTMLDDFEALLEIAERITKSSSRSVYDAETFVAAVNSTDSQS